MKSFTWIKDRPLKGSTYPSAREGHTLTYIPFLKSLLLFGGINTNRMNEVYLYDIRKIPSFPRA